MEGRRKVLQKFREQKDYMADRVTSGIEENRKAWATIQLKDKEGNPLKNVKLKVKQKNHEFKYGANIFMLDEFECEEKNKLYREYFKDCFNMATLPFYWSDLEPEKGKPRYDKNSPRVYRRPATDLCMEYCEENGIEPREHALAYDFFFPQWLWDADIQTVKKEYVRRCKEISERYADRIPTIEVTNETSIGLSRTALHQDPDFIEWAFKTTRRFFPANKLAINDFSASFGCNVRHNNIYYQQIENALLKGAEIDAIGFQYHIFTKPENEDFELKERYNPMQIYKTLDTYSRFNKEMQITEITIPCYTDSAEDEEIQAEIIENLYSIWFSHKYVQQIIYWNVVDGYAAFAPQGDMTAGENFHRGGLVRFDMTLKPAYYKIKELFEKRWHTETEIETNGDGIATFKGFFGDYEIELSGGEKKDLRLLKSGKKDFEIIL